MKSIKIFLSVIFALLSSSGFAQISIDWSRSYNPVSNNSQSANDVAADVDGNSYWLGYTSRGYNGTDVALVKYGPAGEFRWARSFDGNNENNSDIGRSVTTFKNGNETFIYAGCDISVSGYGNQMSLLKYDTAGTMLWQKQFPLGSNSSIAKVITDAAGNIFVGGGNPNGGSGMEIFILKFNPSGDTLWTRKLPNMIGAYNSFANDIAVDDSGNVYGTGRTYDNASRFDLVTFKYSPNGSLRWSKIYNFGFNNDVGNSIALGKSGSVFVTGRSDAANTLPDVVTIRYNSYSGDTLWVKRYSGVSNVYDDGKDIAVDLNNNVYITGQIDGATFSGDIGTFKYDSSGTLQWLRKYIGPPSVEDAGKSVLLDSLGNIYVGGRISAGYGAKYIAIKYNLSGDSLWTRLYDNGTIEEFFAMRLDKNLNLVMVGECDNLDMAGVKYNSAGQLQWARKFYGAQLYSDHVNSLVTDKNGNVYACGKSRVSQYGDQFTVLKYNPAGTLVWYRSYGVQLFDNYDEAKDIAIDSSGFVYVTGVSYSRFNNLSLDYFTVKLDTNGNQQWFATHNGIGNGNDDAKSIAVDNNGNCYVTGQSVGTGLSADYCTIKYGPAGTKLWTAYYNGESNGADYAYDIKVDNSGNVFVTGQSGGAGTADDAVTVKYSPTGMQLWASRYNGSANLGDYGNTIEIDKSGHVYVCGYATENSTGINSLLLKYLNSNGALRWVRHDSNSNSATETETAASIKFDTAKRFLYLAGHWHGDPGKAKFVAKYDTAGNRIHRSTFLFYYLGSQVYLHGLAVDKNDNFMTVGSRKYNSSGKSNLLMEAHDSSGTGFKLEGYELPEISAGPDSKDAIAIAPNGDIFLGGGLFDSTAGTLMAVVKFKQKPFVVNLTVLLEGFYSPISNTLTPDTLTGFLSYVYAPGQFLDTAIALLNTNGQCQLHFNKRTFSDGDQFYLVLKHRNSIMTWTALTVTFSSGTLNYNFTTSNSQAFGTNQKQVDASPVRFAMFGGDVNQDGTVDATDVSMIDNDASNFVGGYVETDLTGDDFVDATDFAIADNNASNFVSVISP